MLPLRKNISTKTHTKNIYQNLIFSGILELFLANFHITNKQRNRQTDRHTESTKYYTVKSMQRQRKNIRLTNMKYIRPDNSDTTSKNFRSSSNETNQFYAAIQHCKYLR